MRRLSAKVSGKQRGVAKLGGYREDSAATEYRNKSLPYNAQMQIIYGV